MADWRSFSVLRRNALVYLRNWRTSSIPPALEPILFLFAFGLGLGGVVEGVDVGTTRVDYATYIAPGLLAYAGFATPYYEALYSAYVRMFYQKTWDGILATQVELPHVVWGEILWGAMRGMLNVSIVCVVLAGCALGGLIDIKIQWLPLLPLFAGFAGLGFAAFALIFTAIVPAIDHMNYPVFLIGWPLSLVSNTFFPVAPEDPLLATLVALNPVYHLSEACRGLLVHGSAGPHIAGLALTTIVLVGLSSIAAIALTRRRVFGT